MAIKVSGINVIDDNRRLANTRLTTSYISANTTAVTGTVYIANTSLVLTLPASPTAGDQVGFNNQSTITTSTIARNSSRINALAEDMTVDVAYSSFNLVYVDSVQGWILF
jgi:hypothetical protein